MKEVSGDDDLIDRIYAVAMEPERYRELVDIWQKRLIAVDKDSFPKFDGDIDMLVRHVERAETILSLVSANADVLPQPLQEKLNSEPQAVFAVSQDGTVEAFNPSAERFFELQEGSNVSDLPIQDHGKDIVIREIRRLFKTVDEGMDDLSPGIFQIARMNNDSPFLLTFASWVTSGGRRFVLIKSTDFYWPEYLTPLVQSAFGLTAAESDVVKLIVEGNSVDNIAENRGSAIKTVRAQIRSIYEKTSTTNQSEFIRMAIGLTTLNMSEPNKATGAYQFPGGVSSKSYPFPDHQRMMTLPDGRILDYADFGPKDGIPCVFYHNEYFGNIWPAKMGQFALQKGLRVILPARAFYGKSSPYPPGVANYEQTAADFEILFKKLELKKVIFLSQTVGGMFSFYHTLAHPERVAALVSVTPMYPYQHREHEDKMPKFTKFMATVVSRHPKLLEFVTKAGLLYHDRVGSVRFLETMIGQSKSDLEIINNPEYLETIVRGFKFSTTYKHQGCFNDYRTLIPDSWDKLVGLSARSYALIGTKENNSRKARALDLIKAGADIDITDVEGGGELLFFSHPKMIVDTIVRAWVENTGMDEVRDEQ